MSNPQISFRLTHYQLARGLKILRQIEPGADILSLSQLVKALYIDYITKTSLNKDHTVTETDIAEITELIISKRKPMSFKDFQIATIKETSTKPSSDKPSSDKSEITSVSDFSPPKNWTDVKV